MPRILPAHSAHFIRRFRHLHAAALAAAAGVDLRLYDPYLAASSRAAFTASSTEKQGKPRGVATPYFRRISLACIRGSHACFSTPIRRTDCSAARGARIDGSQAGRIAGHILEQVGVAALLQLFGPTLDRHELAPALVADDAADGARV